VRQFYVEKELSAVASAAMLLCGRQVSTLCTWQGCVGVFRCYVAAQTILKPFAGDEHDAACWRLQQHWQGLQGAAAAAAMNWAPRVQGPAAAAAFAGSACKEQQQQQRQQHSSAAPARSSSSIYSRGLQGAAAASAAAFIGSACKEQQQHSLAAPARSSSSIHWQRLQGAAAAFIGSACKKTAAVFIHSDPGAWSLEQQLAAGTAGSLCST
jgi:hypothetical protein